MGLERRRFGDLSGGQQRRVLFAIASSGDPELLFFDEPTTGLDVEIRRGLWSTLRSLAASGRGVVLTTHYLKEADALADRVVVLHHGHLIAEGAPDPGEVARARATVRARTRAAVDVGGTDGWHARSGVRTVGRGGRPSKEQLMSNNTYRITEIVGTSPDGIDQAIRNGVTRASRTIRHLDWFEVTEIRGQVVDGGVEHFQVGMKVGFRLEDD